MLPRMAAGLSVAYSLRFVWGVFFDGETPHDDGETPRNPYARTYKKRERATSDDVAGVAVEEVGDAQDAPMATDAA